MRQGLNLLLGPQVLRGHPIRHPWLKAGLKPPDGIALKSLILIRRPAKR